MNGSKIAQIQADWEWRAVMWADGDVKQLFS